MDTVSLVATNKLQTTLDIAIIQHLNKTTSKAKDWATTKYFH